MQTALIIVHIFVCIFMILVILLQPSKEGGFGGMGGTSSSVFGGRGSTSFLGKVTTVCAALFMVLSLTLAYLSSKTESIVLAHSEPAKAKAVAKDAAPAATDAVAAPAATGATAAPAGNGGTATATSTVPLNLAPGALAAPANGQTAPAGNTLKITPAKPANK